MLVEAYSDWSKKTEPLVFWLPYGQGRVVHSTFGHDAKAIATPEVTTIIVRGVEWAATGKVAQEVSPFGMVEPVDESPQAFL